MNATKRDYYEVSGRGPRHRRSGPEERVPQARAQCIIRTAIPTTIGRGRKVQGSRRSVQRAQRSAEARGIRSLRPSGTAGAGRQPGLRSVAFTDFSDILGDLFGFGDLFGGGGRRRSRSRAQRGEDLRYDLEIGLEDALRGLSVEIQVPRMDVCSRCQGSGRGEERRLGHLPDVPRTRRGDLPAELPPDPADLRPVQRPRADRAAPLHRSAAASGRSAPSASSRSTFQPASTPERI